MRKSIFAIVAMLFAACATDQTTDVQFADVPETLTVSFEEDSRIQLNESQKTVWTNGDFVSVFYKSNANQKWVFQGETGERTANLKRLDAGKATTSNTRVIVVYPYNVSYDFNAETYNICTQLPATQHYMADSYGLDGNIMVSSGEYNQFCLKSVYGWLKLQITGNGEKVRVINLSGNNAEQVAGEAYIYTNDATMSLAADMLTPGDDHNVGGNLIFDDTIITKLTLNCGEGVTLSQEPTSFYIALPPQTFTDGITVDIKTTDGRMMHKSSNKELVIDRNTIQPMAAFAFECNGGNGIFIPDEALKSYLVNNYDDDCDGEISIEEAEYITMVNCSNKGVEDLTGLESCPNLVTLNCSNNNIKEIVVPNLTSLKTVTCDGNPIEKLNFDNCIALRYLNLQGVTTNAISETAISIDNYTQAETFYFTATKTPFRSFTFNNSSILTTLKLYGEFTDVTVKNNAVLTLFTFDTPVVNATISGNRVLEGIDVSTLSQLETLDVQKCKLQSLDVTKNLALTSLVCNNNELTTLDVSNNTSLVKFYCNDNKLPLIRVNTNTLLEEFDISNNLLSTLNVRKNTALKYLCVSNNAALTMVDVQYNTALEVLIASGLAITDIDLTANTALKGAELFNTNLTSTKKLDTTGLGCVYIKKTPYSVGKMVSVAETSTSWGLYGATTGATNADDGMKNVNTMKSKGYFNSSSAFTWCANYGTDWYLPALNELKAIYNNKSTINSTLSARGYTTFGTSYYWSSTEDYNYRAYILKFSDGNSGSYSKDETNKVRAVLAF